MSMLGCVDASGFMLVPEASPISDMPALFIELMASAWASRDWAIRLKPQNRKV